MCISYISVSGVFTEATMLSKEEGRALSYLRPSAAPHSTLLVLLNAARFPLAGPHTSSTFPSLSPSFSGSHVTRPLFFSFSLKMRPCSRRSRVVSKQQCTIHAHALTRIPVRASTISKKKKFFLLKTTYNLFDFESCYLCVEAAIALKDPHSFFLLFVRLCVFFEASPRTLDRRVAECCCRRGRRRGADEAQQERDSTYQLVFAAPTHTPQSHAPGRIEGRGT